MLSFSSDLIRTDVTCVKIFGEFIICGIGDYFQIYDITTLKLVRKKKVFNGLKINGIEINSEDQILVCASNEAKVYHIEWQRIEFAENASCLCSDWILKAKWIDTEQNVVTITMHNVVEYFTNELQLMQRIICEEQCILYSAHISYTHWEDIVILSGTVFSEILIWKPSENQDDKLVPVLKRLSGHKGVIFSIDHNINSSYICSSSDDRSVILWSIKNPLFLKDLNKNSDEIDISLHVRMYGHSARVFGCKVVTDRVLSIGEDGILNIWSLEGILCNKLSAHQSGSIWALDVDVKKNIIVSGGADSAVTIFPLKTMVENKKIILRNKEMPKRIVCLKNNDIVVITENGLIGHYRNLLNTFVYLGPHKELQNYALLEISNCKMKIAAAGFFGHIFVYNLLNEKELILSCSYQIKTRSRIYSLHWLSCTIILTCGMNGLLYLWKLVNDTLLLLHIMELPITKERWSTSGCICNRGIAVGDRKGNLHYYNLDNFKPTYTIKKAHNYLGVNYLYYSDNKLFSLGRNSTIRKYKFEDKLSEIQPLFSDKLPFMWLASLTNNHFTTILLAFAGSDFIIWDYNLRRTLLTSTCGGGHRSWAYNQDGNNIKFSYIKDKCIYMLDCKWDSIYSCDLIPGVNCGEINALKTISLSEKLDDLLIISGGEDTTLRISKLANCHLANLITMKSHLSSIRCIHLLQIDATRYFLFSAGGRAQIILWELTLDPNNNNVTCNELFAYYEPVNESETRIMDLCCVKLNSTVYLMAACSNGEIKIFSTANNSLKYISCLRYYKLKCILKITIVAVKDCIILITMATDGCLAFWKLSETRLSGKNKQVPNDGPFFVHKTHKSGINSFSIKKYSDEVYFILTGGDDNAINLIMFSFINSGKDCRIKIHHTHSNSDTHCAQITGVHLTDEYIISSSLDQNLVVYKYSVENNAIQTRYCGFYETTIADIKGLEVYEIEKQFKLVIFGLGIEILTLLK